MGNHKHMITSGKFNVATFHARLSYESKAAPPIALDGPESVLVRPGTQEI